MPTVDETNDNNIQGFVSEYVINTIFQTLRDSKETLEITSEWISSFGLSELESSMYLSHIFPELSCVY